MSYEPSDYWKHLNAESNRMLKDYGYENFKRSVGLVYNDFYYDCIKGVYHENYDKYVIDIWDALYATYPNDFLDQFYEPEEGNPKRIVYRDRLVSIDLASSLVEYILLASKIDLSEVKVIHEIGAGYGRLGYVIAQLIKDVKYKIFDLDMSLNLSERYLSTVLPKADFEFHSPEKLDGKCDILIAMNCLHEMTKEQVESHFDYADKNTSYFYYTCWEDSSVNKNNIRWRRQDYPVRDSWVPVHIGKHSSRVNFFEALYKI